MSEYTPGPWKYEVNRTCDGYEKHIIRSEAKLKPYKSDWICACGGMKEGDGNLIAAAPELLNVLEDLLQLAQYCDDGQYMNYPGSCIIFDNAREVIAKAKG